jgi:N-acetylmuramoyl-L-alanine amidase CwlA
MQKIIELLLRLIKGYFGTDMSRITANPVKAKSIIENYTNVNFYDDYINVNKYSRPGKKLKKVKGIVIHWTAAPNQGARAVRTWFDSRKGGKYGYGSAHLAIDLNGDILRMIPFDEIAYHVGARTYKGNTKERLSKNPNDCTLGIECCVIDKNGTMRKETKESLVKLTAYLCRKYGLTSLDTYLHYDITGKMCHLFYVKKPEQWTAFLKKVGQLL